MSSTTTTSSNGAPFQQWQNFYPNGAAGGADMPYAYMPYGDAKVQDSVINAERNLTKEVTQSTLGLRDAVERGNLQIVGDVERTAGQAQTTMERVGANGTATTERANGQVMGSVERNGGNIMTAIEKVAGENRLTTAVSSAANRQAASDSARDLAIAIERNGANAVDASKDAQTALLGSIERNAGEGRVTTVTSQGFLDSKILDVRHSVINRINDSTNELVAVNTNNANVVAKAIHDSAVETRQVLGSGFSNIQGGLSELAVKSSDQYSSMMLEQQKMGQYLASKSDNQFAMTQMEMQKCKADLAAQSAQQFSMNQLENQKLGSSISAQLAEAKYDALKNTQELGNKIEKCCCELKEKNDRLERESLRDELIKANSDNNLLKTPYTLGSGVLGYPGVGPGFGPGFGPYGGPGFGYGGGFGHGFGNDVGYGNNVHIHSSERENSPGPIRGGHGHGHGGCSP
jgi:hypothetical protein